MIFVAGRSCWEAHRVQSKHQGAVTWIHRALKAAELCSQLVPRRLVCHQQTASWELGFVFNLNCCITFVHFFGKERERLVTWHPNYLCKEHISVGFSVMNHQYRKNPWRREACHWRGFKPTQHFFLGIPALDRALTDTLSLPSRGNVKVQCRMCKCASTKKTRIGDAAFYKWSIHQKQSQQCKKTTRHHLKPLNCKNWSLGI